MNVFLFPGQGSQKPGMGHDFFQASEAAKKVFEEAQGLAPEGFLDTIFEGSPEEVTNTCVAQPGLLIVEVAIAKHLQAQGIQPTACTGHSLGEIPALVVSGACPFADALRLTFERARLMSEDLPKGSMAAVIGFDPVLIEAILPEGVQIANYNGPGQTIISGRLDALEEAIPALKEAGAKRVLPLKVSGPFHSECMRPAVPEFQKVLETIPFATPTTRFISSVSGQEENDPARIRALLGEQLVSPVRWTQVMDLLGTVAALEVGPGNVLKGLARRMENVATIQTTGSLDEIAALEA